MRAAGQRPQIPNSPIHPCPPVDGGHLGGLTRGEWGGAGEEVSVMGAQGVRAPPPQVKLLKRTFKVDVQQPIRG